LFSDYDVPEDGEEGKDRRHGRLSVDDEERNMVNLEPIGEIMHSSSSLICMRDDDDFVSSVNEFLISRQPLIWHKSSSNRHWRAGKYEFRHHLMRFSLPILER
jgi:hypothetical protein